MQRTVGMIVALVLAIGAVGVGLLAHAEYRAAIGRKTLLRIETSEDAALRAGALQSAEHTLAAPSQTGALDELKARLVILQAGDLGDATQLSLDALMRSPAREESWARLAYLDAVKNGDLSSEGLAALNHSFIARPYPPLAFQFWRVEFTMSYWRDLDNEARGHLGRALEALPKNSNTKSKLRELADGPSDPAAQVIPGEYLDF